MKTKKFVMVFLSVFFIVLLASQVSAFTSHADPLTGGKKLGLAKTGNPAYLHKVFVGFMERPGKAEEAIVAKAGGKVKYRYNLVAAIAATVPEAAIDGLLRSPKVSYIELDDVVYAINAELDNSWGVKRISAGSVHDGGNKGQGVKIAVIDSGIDYNHPDLSANYAGGYDFVNKDNDPFDDNGHGTHVAGTVAAVVNNAGVVGVAPEAWLYVLKVLNASGSGNYSDIVAALQWAVNNGMDITNNSYGSSSNPGITVEQAFDNAYNAGLLHVAAAGNSGNTRGTGDNVIYPARYATVIAVAATDKTDKRASFSSTGTAVELAAPGVSINSTLPGGGYASWNGTSMASPHVAGTAALVLSGGVADSNNNGRINDEVRQILTATADDLGNAGRDAWYGFGLVNALAAAVVLPPPSPAISMFINSITYAESGRDLMITVSIVDAPGNPVAGAAVLIDLFRNGAFVSSGTGITGDNGAVSFRRKNALKGCYETRVAGVTVDGYIWDGGTPPNGYCKK